ncbi:MAG: YbjQ family protein [Actinomycetota bacterium]
MIVSTMNDLPGYRVDEVLGEVTGLTVRSRNVGAQLGAGLKSIVGGELKGLTKQLQQSRDEAKQRLIEAAEAVGANAILAMRFDSDEVGTGYQELVAYGTAVKVSPI